MELTLSGCSITHIPKDGKKKKHELKIVHQGADALVLAVQSKEQAEEWLKVKYCWRINVLGWTWSRTTCLFPCFKGFLLTRKKTNHMVNDYGYNTY